jgi:hypothetical protein
MEYQFTRTCRNDRCIMVGLTVQNYSSGGMSVKERGLDNLDLYSIGYDFLTNSSESLFNAIIM